MRKYVLLAIFALFCFNSSLAQHLKVKGVPMEGSAYSFAMKLKNKGVNHIGEDRGIQYLEGDFAGYFGCLFSVAETNNKQVCTVSILLPEADAWSKLERNYARMKEMLTAKYGQPTKCEEKFNSRNQPTTDSDRWHELQMDRCTYSSAFESNEGDIVLSIVCASFQCRVVVQYFDKINQEQLNKEIQDEI